MNQMLSGKKKLLAMVIGSLLVWANQFLPEGSRLPTEALLALAALAATYILAETAVDRARARCPPAPPKPKG